MAEDNIERGMNSELYNYQDKIKPNDKICHTNKVVPVNETRVRNVISNIIDNNIQDMDTNNKRIALIMKDNKNDIDTNMNNAVKEMFNDKNGKPISYSEMRDKYG